MTGTLDLFGWQPVPAERGKSGRDNPGHDNAVGGGHDRQDESSAAGNVADPQIGTEGSSAPLTHAPRLSIEERFESFHKANPQVADRMLTLARRRLDRGETFISVKALWEELRASFQKSDLAYDGFDTTKLNNSYTALYARLIIKLEPRLGDVIELRKRKGE